MRLIGKNYKATIALFVYYFFAYYLPQSGRYGNIVGRIRFFLCKYIFLKCGNHVNIERKAFFGNGALLEIGDYSGIGVNAVLPNNSKIGCNVMMGPNCYVLERNHSFERIDIPMRKQGFTASKPFIIEDDVWIGRDVLVLPGKTIRMGSIIAAGCVLSKDFPSYSIVGGNPSRLIRSRL